MILTKESALKTESKVSLRDKIINEIINLILVMDISELNGWEDIEFGKIDSLKNNSSISTEELIILQEILENKYEEMLYQMYLEEYYLQ
ncbi:hypothetical protein [Niallia oryzisoli]|uniref:hypothetical protein n=1 Tax=Niallia oryzisoli TaxID=1737571 RepID=UPI003735FACF